MTADLINAGLIAVCFTVALHCAYVVTAEAFRRADRDARRDPDARETPAMTRAYWLGVEDAHHQVTRITTSMSDDERCAYIMGVLDGRANRKDQA